MITTETPIFKLAGRKLESFHLNGKAALFTVADGDSLAEVHAPAGVRVIAVSQRLHGDWYAEVEGRSFRRSAVADVAADAIRAALAKSGAPA